jgi:hypothetical protein
MGLPEKQKGRGMVAWCHGNLHRNTTASSKKSSCRGWDGSSPLLQKKVGWCVSSVAEGEESWGALALKGRGVGSR